MRNVSLTQYDILIMFQLTNGNPGARICDVVVDADTRAANTKQSLINIIGSGAGIYWWSNQVYTMTVIVCSNYPLTTSLSTYWCGYLSSRATNHCNQGTSTSSDYGFAMSWQNMSVPGSGSNNIPFMFRLRLHYNTDQLTITVPAYAQYIPVSGPFIVGFPLSDPLSGQILDVFVVSDWDLFRISRVGSEVNAGNPDLPVD
jgi:hypothetical protein